ncbi:hypothetical protein ONZ45_g657 [Pleurotus djamor]|nr:hypothetical protein ONZ45_g657 [Pleurotus djamor]
MATFPQTDTPRAILRFFPTHNRLERQKFSVYKSEVVAPSDQACRKGTRAQKSKAYDNLEMTRLKRLFELMQFDSTTENVLEQLDLPKFQSFETFLADANALSEEIHGHDNEDLIVFKKTGAITPPGHITDTESRPDITAARKKYWFDGRSPPKKPGFVTDEEETYHCPWPCVSLAAEEISSSDSALAQQRHAITYLDLLLLSRPDLRGAFGLLTTHKTATLFFGIGGFCVKHFSFRWGTDHLAKAMSALVYLLYHPGYWQQTSIRLDRYERSNAFCYYEITFQKPLSCVDEPSAQGNVRPDLELQCPNFVHRSAQCTFGSRSHIFVFRPPSDAAQPPRFQDKPIRVIKSQLVREEEGQYEPDFLRKVHDPDVPGVVHLTCYTYQSITVPSLADRKTKRHVLLGLEEEGHLFMQIASPQDMLMNAYNYLETTRFLHSERGILHRDLSEGNTLFIPRSSDQPPDGDLTFIPLQLEPERGILHHGLGEGSALIPRSLDQPPDGDLPFIPEPPRTYAFVGYSLDAANKKPSSLIIDFNRAANCNPTPDASTESSKEVTYERQYPERKQRFLKCQDMVLKEEKHHGVLKHELYHDAESIFWLIFVWILFADPEPDSVASDSVAAIPPPTESTAISTAIARSTWSNLISPLADGRVNLVLNPPSDLCHPQYKDLFPLIQDLCGFLLTDPYWFKDSAPRNHPEYMHESLQRIIYSFLQTNWNADFMLRRKLGIDRQVEVDPLQIRRSSTVVQRKLLTSSVPPIVTTEDESQEDEEDADAASQPGKASIGSEGEGSGGESASLTETSSNESIPGAYNAFYQPDTSDFLDMQPSTSRKRPHSPSAQTDAQAQVNDGSPARKKQHAPAGPS